MKQAIRKNIPYMAAILLLAAVALAVGYYILQQQRLRIPFLEEEPFRVNVELSTGQAVTPGQGQTAQVAGVTIGRIGEVKLDDGVAVVGLDIFPKYSNLIHTDAKALLRPRTGLKDMYIQIFPGDPDKPSVPEGYTIPQRNTAPDVDLHEILGELDDRTQDYLRLFIHGAGRGLEDRGDELAEVFKRFKPTFRDLARVNRSVAQERRELKRLITSLAALNERLAENPDDLAELVDASAATFGAFASEEDQLRATVTELAPTLQLATATLRDLRPLAREIGPATRALTPAFRELDDANEAVQPFAREATPILRDDIRPFIRASRPLVRDLAPAAQDLAKTMPELRRDLSVFNRLFNMLTFNPNGSEPPEKANREEGYLFWLSWLGHQTINLVNIQDANGPMRPLFLTGTCGTLTSIAIGEPALENALNLSPVLATVCGNPATPSISPEQALEDLIGGLTPAQRKKVEDLVP